jgi:hypothetical protein
MQFDPLFIAYAFVFALLFYIGVLHYKLMKKNLFINGIIQKLSKIENNWNRNEVVKFLKRLEKTDTDFIVREDRIMDEKVLNFLFGEGNSCKFFLHYTAEKTVAEKILQEGFRFSGSFHKTAEPLIPGDTVTLAYKHNLSKYFGKFVLLIGISTSIYDILEKELKQRKLLNYSVEQILTENEPTVDEDFEEYYILPRQFIKGYVNYETGEIILNSNYKPDFTTPVFMKNLEKLSLY